MAKTREMKAAEAAEYCSIEAVVKAAEYCTKVESVAAELPPEVTGLENRQPNSRERRRQARIDARNVGLLP